MQQYLKRLRIWLRRYGKTALAGLACMSATVGLLWFRLASLTHGASEGEISILTALKNQTLSLNDIARSPLFLPYKLGLYILEKTNHISLFYLRSLSAIFGLIAVILFYLIASHWYSKRLAAVGTALFISSSWFLHVARLGSPLILFVVGIISILACALLIQKYPDKNWSYAVSIFVCVFALYIPGLMWIILVALVWQRKMVWQAFRRHHPILILSTALAAIALAPLVIACTNHISILQTTMGVSGQGSDIMVALREMAITPVRLAVHNRLDPTIALGQVPLLDGLTAVMVVIGLYALARKGTFVRLQVLAVLLLLGTLLTGLSQGLGIVFLLPIIYFFITSGLGWFMDQWLTVFPRNQLARVVGSTLLICSLLLVGFYHFRSYFVAWPNSPTTQSNFRELSP